MKTYTLYLIRRSNEYFGEKGFWALNIYDPNYYHTKETAQSVLNDMHPWESEYCIIEPVEIQL